MATLKTELENQQATNKEKVSLINNPCEKHSYSHVQLINSNEALNIVSNNKNHQDTEISVLKSELQTLKAYLINLFEFSPIAYFHLTVEGRINEVNLTGTILLGKERSKITNRHITLFIHPNFRETFENHIQQVLDSHCKQTCETQLLKGDGFPIFARIESLLVNGWSKHDRQIHLSMFDITQQKLAEAHYKENEIKFRSFIESTNDWIWYCDLQGNYRYCNPSIEKILGYDSQEMIGKNLFLFLSSQTYITLKKQWSSLRKLKEGWSNLMLHYRAKDNSYVYLESTAVPMYDNNNKMVGILGVDRDITERKKEELQIYKRQFVLAQSIVTPTSRPLT